MEKNKDVINEVLNMFTGDRIWYETPFTVKEKCYATNGSCCISINKELAKHYPELTEYSQEEFIKTVEREDNINHCIEFSELEKLINDFPTVSKDVDNTCSACHGTGDVRWEFSHKDEDYHNTFECPVCNGSGESKEKNVFVAADKRYNAKCFVMVLDNFLKFEFIYKIYQIARHYKLSQIEITYQDNGIKFKIGNFELYIMSVITDVVKNYKILKIV